jgi:hypothetical protein
MGLTGAESSDTPERALGHQHVKATANRDIRAKIHGPLMKYQPQWTCSSRITYLLASTERKSTSNSREVTSTMIESLCGETKLPPRLVQIVKHRELVLIPLLLIPWGWGTDEENTAPVISESGCFSVLP